MSLYLQLLALAIPLLTGTITAFFPIKRKDTDKLTRWGWAIVLINVVATVLAVVTLLVERHEEETKAAAAAELARQEQQLAEVTARLEKETDKAWQEFSERRITDVIVTLAHIAPAERPTLLQDLTLLMYGFSSDVAPEEGDMNIHMSIVSFARPEPGQDVTQLIATPALGGQNKWIYEAALMARDTTPEGNFRLSLSGAVSWTGLNMARIVPTFKGLSDLTDVKVIYPGKDIADITMASISFLLSSEEQVHFVIDSGDFIVDPEEEVTGFHFWREGGRKLLHLAEEAFRQAEDAEQRQELWIEVDSKADEKS